MFSNWIQYNRAAFLSTELFEVAMKLDTDEAWELFFYSMLEVERYDV